MDRENYIYPNTTDETSRKRNRRRSNKIITLTGYLGADPTHHTTEERTEIRNDYNEAADDWNDEKEFTRGGHDYMRLSLAIHLPCRGKRLTKWLQLSIWTEGREMEFFQARLARKGYKVRVTGHYEAYRRFRADGSPYWFQRLIVHTFEILRRKKKDPRAVRESTEPALAITSPAAPAPAPAPAPTVPSWVPTVPPHTPTPGVPQQPALR